MNVGALYARHEAEVLRFFMERVRSPELACDLAAETFAAALADAGAFDPTRSSEHDWLLALANAQLLRAYRVGAVDDAARLRLKLPPVVLDDRTLDRVWQLRGEDRNEERKPRLSGQVLVGEVARAVGVGAAVLAADGVFAPAGGSSEEFVGLSPTKSTLDGGGVLVPDLADALAGAERRREGGRRRKRRLVIAARGAIALVTVGWVVGQAVLPDRPAATGTSWLPYEADGGVSGAFPRLWYFASAPQVKQAGREVVTFTTFTTGGPSDEPCGAVSAMGRADALVAVIDGRPRELPSRCGRVSTTPLEGGLYGLIVLGPKAPERVRAEAQDILDRVEVTAPL